MDNGIAPEKAYYSFKGDTVEVEGLQVLYLLTKDTNTDSLAATNWKNAFTSGKITTLAGSNISTAVGVTLNEAYTAATTSFDYSRTSNISVDPSIVLKHSGNTTTLSNVQSDRFGYVYYAITETGKISTPTA